MSHKCNHLPRHLSLSISKSLVTFKILFTEQDDCSHINLLINLFSRRKAIDRDQNVRDEKEANT